MGLQLRALVFIFTLCDGIMDAMTCVEAATVAAINVKPVLEAGASAESESNGAEWAGEALEDGRMTPDPSMGDLQGLEGSDEGSAPGGGTERGSEGGSEGGSKGLSEGSERGSAPQLQFLTEDSQGGKKKKKSHSINKLSSHARKVRAS